MYVSESLSGTATVLLFPSFFLKKIIFPFYLIIICIS